MVDAKDASCLGCEFLVCVVMLVSGMTSMSFDGPEGFAMAGDTRGIAGPCAAKLCRIFSAARNRSTAVLQRL